MGEPGPEEHREPEADLARARSERDTAHDELRSTLKELEATTEELQSTNEELERMNQALQATNEQLEATNAALQGMNEEVQTLHEELRERTSEAQQTNSLLGSLLSGIQQGVVVVDRTLRIVAWSPRTTELWGLRNEEVEGEHLLDLDIGISVGRLRGPAERVLAGTQVEDIQLDGRNGEGMPVHVRIVFAPFRKRPEADDPDGVILLVSAEPERR
jgi:two-component system CheB/CheR fusion protein